MLYHKMNEIAESYINGNIEETKKSVKRMSKSDLISFIAVLAGFYPQKSEYVSYSESLSAIRRLLD